jgi:hypothetical protein
MNDQISAPGGDKTKAEYEHMVLAMICPLFFNLSRLNYNPQSYHTSTRDDEACATIPDLFSFNAAAKSEPDKTNKKREEWANGTKAKKKKTQVTLLHSLRHRRPTASFAPPAMASQPPPRHPQPPHAGLLQPPVHATGRRRRLDCKQVQNDRERSVRMNEMLTKSSRGGAVVGGRDPPAPTCACGGGGVEGAGGDGGGRCQHG